MSRSLATTFSEWRFLLLTLLIFAFLLATVLIAGIWPVQMLLEALLLATVLVTVSANPGGTSCAARWRCCSRNSTRA